MLTTSCACGNPKNPNAKQCWSCSNEARRVALRGRPFTEERKRNVSAALKKLPASTWFPVGELGRGKPAPNTKPVGSTVRANGHTMIKCPDGKWRYRARVMWAEANGPIPPGYIVHHVNHDPYDDRLENFQMLTRAEHAKHHADELGHEVWAERGRRGNDVRVWRPRLPR